VIRHWIEIRCESKNGHFLFVSRGKRMQPIIYWETLQSFCNSQTAPMFLLKISPSYETFYHIFYHWGVWAYSNKKFHHSMISRWRVTVSHHFGVNALNPYWCVNLLLIQQMLFLRSLCSALLTLPQFFLLTYPAAQNQLRHWRIPFVLNVRPSSSGMLSYWYYEQQKYSEKHFTVSTM